MSFYISDFDLNKYGMVMFTIGSVLFTIGSVFMMIPYFRR